VVWFDWSGSVENVRDSIIFRLFFFYFSLTPRPQEPPVRRGGDGICVFSSSNIYNRKLSISCVLP